MSTIETVDDVIVIAIRALFDSTLAIFGSMVSCAAAAFDGSNASVFNMFEAPASKALLELSVLVVYSDSVNLSVVDKPVIDGPVGVLPVLEAQGDRGLPLLGCCLRSEAVY